MRFLGTSTLLLLLVLTGCGSIGDDADDVPTITVRPPTPTSSDSTPTQPTSSTPPTSAPTSSEPTDEPTATATETGPSPEPPTDEPVGPTTYAAARDRIDDRGTSQVAAARFSTAEDVIYCLLDDPVIGPACELRHGFVRDEEVCGGAAEGVGRIETFEGRARPVCNSDTIREPGAEVIGRAGVVVSSGSVECLVEAAGVTCLDTAARTGFFLAPREYHVF